MTDSNTLTHLYDSHTQNVSDKWNIYLSKYEDVFSPYRELPVRLLEIGIQNGGSLQIWQEYFGNAQLILGCDINPKCTTINHASEHIKVIIGDVNAEETLQEISALSENLDIIIDDGSHVSSDIINTFCRLFPLLNLEGSYVIEDLHCSYWDQFEGGLYHPYSSIDFFKRLIDIVNYEHWGLEKSRRSHLEPFGIPDTIFEKDLSELHSIEFINSMCIIKKKASEFNLLGKRRVVGQIETVSPVLHVADTYNQTPRQNPDAPDATDPAKDQGDLIRVQQERIDALEKELSQLRTEPLSK